MLILNTIKKYLYVGACVLLISCTSDGIEPTDVETLETSNEMLLTSGGNCSPTVKFGNLLVETSWITGIKGDRIEFGACGVDNEAWMDKYVDGRFMLKSLAAHGQRTELKEKVGDEANLTQYKRMTFKAKFTDIPNHGVTIAQIHNRAEGIVRPWIRLYIDKDKRFKIKTTETAPTEVLSTYKTYIGMLYHENTEVFITVWTGISGQEKAKIRVDYRGQRFQQNLVPSAAWDNFSDSFYLKAGVYTEGEDKQAKVTYGTFGIIH